MRQQEYKKQNKVVLEGIEPVESREERLHMARQAFGRENMTYETAKRSERHRSSAPVGDGRGAF